jgi:hypothetical protein
MSPLKLEIIKEIEMPGTPNLKIMAIRYVKGKNKTIEIMPNLNCWCIAPIPFKITTYILPYVIVIMYNMIPNEFAKGTFTLWFSQMP